MAAPRPERHAVSSESVVPAVDQYEREAWQDLQAVLEERDREWWADAHEDDDA